MGTGWDGAAIQMDTEAVPPTTCSVALTRASLTACSASPKLRLGEVQEKPVQT